MIGAALAYLRPGFQTCIADRGLLVSDLIFASAIPFTVQAILWTAVYDGQPRDLIDGLTYRQILFYYAYVIVFWRAHNGYGIVEQISNSIAEGTLEVHLARPVPYPIQQMADWFAGTGLYLLPILIVGSIDLVSRPVPIQIGAGESALFMLGLAVLILLSATLCFLVSFGFALACFWLIRPQFLLYSLLVLQSTLGGILLPPDLWPDWLEPLMSYNPFRYIIAAPAEVLASYSVPKLVECIAASSLYCCIGIALNALLWRAGRRHHLTAGG